VTPAADSSFPRRRALPYDGVMGLPAALRWAVAVGWLLSAGCAGPLGGRPRGGPPVVQALLLNGGGTARTNYYSHALHLASMRHALMTRGVDPRYIDVLSADGESIAPDLAMVRVAEGPHAWLLEGTALDRSLRRPLRFVSAHNKETSHRAATRASLDGWFDEAREKLRPGDTLLFFVTDHGERGKTAEQTRITLWNRESITVAELRERLGTLPVGVRVVQLMSQCFSGAFAETALTPPPGRPIGETCGYYATTADRLAYGCYPDATAEHEGHAIRFAQALTRRPSLGASHDEVLVTDRTPDVPVRSSDLALERFVRRVADRRQISVESLVSGESAVALARGDLAREAATVQAVSRSFSIPTPTEPGSLAPLDARLAELGKRFGQNADTWEAAVGELAQGNLDQFLVSAPGWKDRVLPRELARLPFSRLRPLQERLVDELTVFTRTRPDRLTRLQEGRVRLTAARAARDRSQIRLAALLRLRLLLTSAVGRHLLDSDGTAEDRAGITALRACEDRPLGSGPGGAAGEEPAVSPPFPSIESDERLVGATAPAFLGVSLADLPAAERTALRLPEGAMTVVGVEPGSPAAAAAIARGDVLLGETGSPASDRGSLKLALASGWDLQRELALVRAGRPVQVTVTFTRVGLGATAKDLPAAGRNALGALTPLRGRLLETVAPTRPYLLFFWATWCTFCKFAVPELLDLERTRGIRIVSITDENKPTIEAFLQRWPTPFPEVVALDLDRTANEAFEVDGYPTFILVDERGRMTQRWSGYRQDTGLPIPDWKWK
jgi:thiol-disulfide isomerase/thioredoxin